MEVHGQNGIGIRNRIWVSLMLATLSLAVGCASVVRTPINPGTRASESALRRTISKPKAAEIVQELADIWCAQVVEKAAMFGDKHARADARISSERFRIDWRMTFYMGGRASPLGWKCDVPWSSVAYTANSVLDQRENYDEVVLVVPAVDAKGKRKPRESMGIRVDDASFLNDALLAIQVLKGTRSPAINKPTQQMKLKKLLREGKISQETYDASVNR